MGKRTLSVIIVSVLLFATCMPLASGHGAPFPTDYDPTHLVIDTIGPPETTDPAWCYDTASAELIMNVYETLTAFDISYTDDPYAAGKMDQFVPELGTQWEFSSISESGPGGITYVRKLTVKVRGTDTISTADDVPFHNGANLTAEDVEYSFERWMVQDRSGGPTWMIYQPLLNAYKAAPPSGPGADPNWGLKIDSAVRLIDTNGDGKNDAVVFYFVTTFPETVFLQIISQSWASVVNKAWAQANGDFNVTKVPGGWANWADIYDNAYGEWHNPAVSPIEGKMMGTGPYEFDYWEAGTGWEIERYNNYWDGWPARVRWNSDERIGGYVNTVTCREIPEWTTRRDLFLGGVSDVTVVPRMYRDQILGQMVAAEKVRCYYPYETLAVTSYFYTFNINTISPYMGVSGGLALNTFSQLGIPPNIFGKHSVTGVDEGLNVRKGIAYLFDYNSWIGAAYLGEGWQPSDYIVKGLSYDNPAQQMYTYNETKAIQHLKAAWGGALWNNGMKFTIVYNVGNVPRQTAAEMIRDKLNAINSKFHVEAMGAAWGTVMLPQMVSGQLPIFVIGWLADFPDPHNFAFPFAHSLGTFAAYQGYKNARVDALIDAGIKMSDDTLAYNGELDKPDPRPYFNQPGSIPPDTRWPRRSIYYELQAIAQDDAASVALVQALGRHFEQQWVRGWYYNPIDPGLNYNRFWKAKTHYGDVNNDGSVNSLDAAFVSGHWYSPPSVGPLGYAPQADITGGKGGTTGTESGYVKAISDGRVNIIEIGLVSAYWDDPKGPSSP